MNIIAVLDFEHLDNGIFLNAFAQALARQQADRCIVLHGDSAYTDRLIQTGMMRSDAQLRSIRDLNHRLVALFADNGVPTIGVNGYQRSLLQWDEQQNLELDRDYYQQLSDRVVLLISSLVQSTKSDQPVAMPLPELAHQLKQLLDFDEIVVFSPQEEDEILTPSQGNNYTYEELTPTDKEHLLPREFRSQQRSVRVVNTHQFGQFPNEKGTKIKKNG
jgi:hypothetical protein